jgi:hypothetical protein
MAGDLEEFLRRAAARRQQQTSVQKPQPVAPRREPPQYSDSRTERIVRSEPEPVLLAAEVVENSHNSYAAQLQQIDDARRAAAAAERKAAQAARNAAEVVRSASATTGANAAQELIRLIRRPGGIQQAILLREILDRPEHRW